MSASKVLTFRPREFKGSRLRCLLATHRSRAEVAEFLSKLAAPVGVVRDTDHWLPGGLLQPGEAKLGETEGLLGAAERTALTEWWLARAGRANTPNWDLASTCEMGGRCGVMLVEAKAHVGELADDCCGATDRANAERIAEALKEATEAWNRLEPGFSLRANSHYQMSNRWAFAWKVASLGVPVILVYLGFVCAEEMRGKQPFRDLGHWRDRVVKGARGVVPATAWDRSFDVSGTPVNILIRAADVRITAS